MHYADYIKEYDTGMSILTLKICHIRYDEEDGHALRRSGSPGVARPGSSSSMRRSMSPAARQRSQSPGTRSFHETVSLKIFKRDNTLCGIHCLA